MGYMDNTMWSSIAESVCNVRDIHTYVYIEVSLMRLEIHIPNYMCDLAMYVYTYIYMHIT